MIIGTFVYGKSAFGVPKSSTMKAFGGPLACLWASRGPKEGFLVALMVPHFGDRRYNFGTKNGARGPPKAPKVGSKWLQNPSKIRSKFH